MSLFINQLDARSLVKRQEQCIDEQCMRDCTHYDKELCEFKCECEEKEMAELNTMLPSGCKKVKKDYVCKRFCYGTCKKICYWNDVLECSNLTNG